MAANTVGHGRVGVPVGDGNKARARCPLQGGVAELRE